MKIGLFDSGVGGIAVLKKLIDRFPGFDYVYLADTKRAPFGTKSEEELKRIVEEDLKILEHLGSDVVVAACNTADSVATHMELSLPYVSIIESGVDMVSGNKIGILATNATVEMGSYSKRLKGKEVVQESLQSLVSIVESDLGNEEMLRSIIERSLNAEIFQCDEVILGCTHFSLISDIFKKVLKIKVIDPAERIVEKIEGYGPSGSGNIEIYTTSDVLSFKEKIEKFGILNGVNPIYRQVEIREKSDSDIGLVWSR